MNESIFDELYIPAGTCSIDPENLDHCADTLCSEHVDVGFCIRGKVSCRECILSSTNEKMLIEYLEAFDGCR